MNSRVSRVVRMLLVASMCLQAVSCGTILYPERRGQPAGRLDPTVVLLDAAGLLFFFVPGVIAFAVDFTTGAIYLPPDCYYGQSPPASGESGLAVIHEDPSRLSQRRIEEIVSVHAGKPISLEPAHIHIRPLDDIEHFAAESSQCADAPIVPVTLRQWRSSGQ